MSAAVHVRSPEDLPGFEGATLADIPVGARCRIIGVDVAGSAAASRRLRDLGFVSGAEILVVRRAPLGDPVVYRICGYDICLRRTHAVAIRVEALPAGALP